MVSMALCQLRQYVNFIAFDNELAIVILNHSFQITYNHFQFDTRCLNCKSLHDSVIAYVL
jgi:hypothetical protein